MEKEAREATRSGGKDISLRMMWGVLTSYLVWIVGVALLIGAIAGVYTKVFVKTQYRNTITFYVFNFNLSSDYMSTTQTTAASHAAEYCIEAAKKDATVRKIVRKNADHLEKVMGTEGERQTILGILRMVGSAHDVDSPFFDITITGEDKTRVKELTACLEREYQTVFQSLFTSESSTTPVTIGEIRLYDSTDEPVAIRPSAVKNALIAAVIAAVLMYAVFFVFSLMDTMIYDEQSIKENFAYPILGSVPEWISSGEHARKRRRFLRRLFRLPYRKAAFVRNYEDKLLTAKTPFVITAAFHLIRTNLSYSAHVEETPVYVTTSACAGSGKSVITANLAVSFSQLGKKTLLVEGDMRMPVFSKLFGINRSAPGLSELLTGMVASTEQVGVSILNENLTVLPAGHIPPNPTDLLAQARVADLMEEWRRTYDIILIDMPPIGEVADAGVVSAHVTGYILDVRSEFSDVQSIQHTVSLLQKVNANIVGFVLNDVSHGTTYGYNPYYKKGRYGYHRYYLSAQDSSTDETSQTKQ